MPSKKTLRRLFCFGLLIAGLELALVVLVVYPLNPQLLIDIRFGLFGRFVTAEELAEKSPKQLRAEGFLVDDPERIDAWKLRMPSELGFLSELPPSFQNCSTLEKAKLLAARMSGGGGNGYFKDSALLTEKLKLMPLGVGKCSDYVEGFQALCSIYGIFTYEFTITHHTIAAVHCPELGKWIFIDPQFCLLARDADGQYLSPLEMRHLALNNGKLDFQFFGEREKHLSRINPFELGYYGAADDFYEFVMTCGNNVFAVDANRTSLRSLPKPIRQMWHKWVGVFPDYMILRDAHTQIPGRVLPLRYGAFGVVALLALLCLPYCLFLIATGAARIMRFLLRRPCIEHDYRPTEVMMNGEVESITARSQTGYCSKGH